MRKCDFKKVAKQLLQNNFIEITLQHGCSPVNLLHVLEYLSLRTPLDSCF